MRRPTPGIETRISRLRASAASASMPVELPLDLGAGRLERRDDGAAAGGDEVVDRLGEAGFLHGDQLRSSCRRRVESALRAIWLGSGAGELWLKMGDGL